MQAPAPAHLIEGALPTEAMRDELLNETLFFGIEHARAAVAPWTAAYNRRRPHSALGNAAPAEFAEKIRLAQEAA